MRLLLLLCLMQIGLAQAIVESPDIAPDEFATTAQKERFKTLIQDLRCTVCQNQNLADSHASLAKDLRREILEMMQQGKTDAQITQHLVDRYGEFVLYKPRFERATYILWVGPFAALLLAVVGFVVLIRRRAAQPTHLSDADKQALTDELRRPPVSTSSPKK